MMTHHSGTIYVDVYRIPTHTNGSSFCPLKTTVLVDESLQFVIFLAREHLSKFYHDSSWPHSFNFFFNINYRKSLKSNKNDFSPCNVFKIRMDYIFNIIVTK